MTFLCILFNLLLPTSSSVSFQDIKNDTIPVYERRSINYELALGYELKDTAGVYTGGVDAWAWYEKEQYKKYTGVSLKINSSGLYSETNVFYQKRPSDNILRGGFNTSLILLKYGLLGGGFVWDKMIPTGVFYSGVKSKNLKIGTNWNKKGVESFDFSLKFIFNPEINKIKSIIPMLIYELDRNRNDNFQFKIVLKRKKG